VNKPFNRSLLHKNNLLALITPSYSSALYCLLLSGVTIGVLVLFHYFRRADLAAFTTTWHETMVNYTYGYMFHHATDLARLQSFAEVAVTFSFWLVVGTIIYFVSYAIIDAVRVAHQTRLEFDYIHIRRKQFILTLLERAGLRLLAVGGALAYIQATLRHGIPSALTASQNTSSALGIALAVAYWVGFACTLHLGVVLTRLLLLRIRVS
jgi:hypothetical protein